MGKDLLERYRQTRADFERLRDVVREIEAAPLERLRDAGWLAERLRVIGLFPVAGFPVIYDDEVGHLTSTGAGMIQLPQEFAEYLVLLTGLKIRSYLEIGTFNGTTACVAAAVLRRFEPEFRLTTVDVKPRFVFYPMFRDMLPIEYAVPRTSFDFRGQVFDAVFIDADHTMEWAWADYENCGRSARVCALHDIRHPRLEQEGMGGSPAAWALLREEEAGLPGRVFHEILRHPAGRCMGIGVRVRTTP